MKKTIAFLLLVSIVFVSKAQDKKTEVSLKAYSISNFNLYELGGGYSFTSRWTFDPLQIGVSWKKNNITQEAILTHLSKEVSSYNSFSSYETYFSGGAGFAYQAGYEFLKPEKKWALSSGIGLKLTGAFTQIVYGKNPDTQTWSDIWTFTFKPYVYSSLTYKLNTHWGISVVPLYEYLGFFTFRQKHHKTQEDWTVGSFNYHSWFPKGLSVRLGCSYTL